MRYVLSLYNDENYPAKNVFFRGILNVPSLFNLRIASFGRPCAERGLRRPSSGPLQHAPAAIKDLCFQGIPVKGKPVKIKTASVVTSNSNKQIK